MGTRMPKKTPEELVRQMEEKNIRCDLKSKEDITEYLREHNNYFRTASYRKNYAKHSEGANKGKYIDLDFSYLAELATIDMHLRFVVMKMCLDIEHSLKVALLSDITENGQEDGYDIVEKFLDNNDYIIKDIFYKSHSTYVGDLIQKYFTFDTDCSEDGRIVLKGYSTDCPVWAFMEIITFGDFTRFYASYYKKYPKKENYESIINSVKSIRNACAHNNCLIHNLRKGSSKPTLKISQFVSSVPTVSKSERKSLLSVRAVYELVALVYLYSEVVFEPVKEHRLKELQDLIHNRMVQHADYFEKQDIVKSAYRFYKKIVDFLIESAYNINDNKKH